jgi:hypothetical protein
MAGLLWPGSLAVVLVILVALSSLPAGVAPALRRAALWSLLCPGLIVLVGTIFNEMESIGVHTPAVYALDAILLAQPFLAAVIVRRSRGYRWQAAAVQVAVFWASVCLYFPAQCSVQNLWP